jgi:hypothetical protein
MYEFSKLTHKTWASKGTPPKKKKKKKKEEEQIKNEIKHHCLLK